MQVVPFQEWIEMKMKWFSLFDPWRSSYFLSCFMLLKLRWYQSKVLKVYHIIYRRQVMAKYICIISYIIFNGLCKYMKIFFVILDIFPSFPSTSNWENLLKKNANAFPFWTKKATEMEIYGKPVPQKIRLRRAAFVKIYSGDK